MGKRTVLRTRVWVTLAIALVGIPSAWMYLQPADPVHHGRRTSEWVEIAIKSESREERARAAKVVSDELGADAVPFIINAIKETWIPRWRWWLSDHSRQLPAAVRDRAEIFHEHYRTLDEIMFLMKDIPEVIAPALPYLMETRRKARVSFVTNMEILHLLIDLGSHAESALPYLQADPESRGGPRFLRATAIYYINGDLRPVLEELEWSVQQPDGFSHVRREIYWLLKDEEALRQIVPFFEQARHDNTIDPSYRVAFFRELARIKPVATNTLQSLQVLMQGSTDTSIQQQCSNTIAWITSED